MLLVVQQRGLVAPDEKLVGYMNEGGDREDVFKMTVFIVGMTSCFTGMPSLFFKGKASQELKLSRNAKILPRCLVSTTVNVNLLSVF
jgi:hypothetical protein